MVLDKIVEFWYINDEDIGTNKPPKHKIETLVEFIDVRYYEGSLCFYDQNNNAYNVVVEMPIKIKNELLTEPKIKWFKRRKIED